MTWPGGTTYPGPNTYPQSATYYSTADVHYGVQPAPDPGYIGGLYQAALGQLPVQWQLDNITFGATDAQGCTWIVKSSNGWFGPPKPKTKRSAKFQTQGSFRSLAPRGERIIVLQGTTKCPNVLARLDALDRLAAMASNPNKVYTLTVTDQTMRPRTIGVELDAQTDVKLAGATWFDWSLQLGAPDPRKHDATWQQPATTVASASTGGLDFSGSGVDFANPGLDFGSASGFPAPATVVNFGTADAYPVIVFTGPVTNPIATDNATGLSVGYAGPLVYGDTVVINCDEFDSMDVPARGVVFNGTSYRRELLTLPQTWPSVGPGEAHDFVSTGSAWGAPSTMTVYMRATWF